jgi:hypothetical protein
VSGRVDSSALSRTDRAATKSAASDDMGQLLCGGSDATKALR